MINTTRKSFVFSGNLANPKGAELPVLVHLEYEEYDPNSLTCTLTIDDMSQFDQIMEEQDARPRIVGELINRSPVFIDFFVSSSTRWGTRGIARLRIDKVTFGHTANTPFSSGTYDFSISILNAPSVRVPHGYSTSPCGEVIRMRDFSDAITWSSDLGDINIANYFINDEAQVGVEHADVQIETSQLLLHGSFANSVNAEERTTQITEGIKDILDLLTLINRKYVRWYAIKADFSEDKDFRNCVHIEVRKRFATYEDRNRDVLFYQQELKKGLLYGLVSAYHSSPIRSSIEKAIMYLAASYEFDKLEAKLLIGYSAYESIVNALSEERGIYKCLKESDFKKLRKEILSLLEMVSRGIKIDYPEDLEKKLSELKSRPITSRVADLIRSLQIEIDDIWDLGEISLEKALQGLNSRRNGLIHDPEKANSEFFSPDLVRIQALSERMILAALGFRGLKRFHPLAYNQLRSYKGVGY